MKRATAERIVIDGGETSNPVYENVESIPDDELERAQEVVISFSNGEEYEASKASGRWTASGTTPEGKKWKAEKFDSLAELIGAVEARINTN